jgi:hypothetical protein
MMNDEAVATLRNKMMTAADRDTEENQMGRPAVHKLRLLPEVVELMQKCVPSSLPLPLSGQRLEKILMPRWDEQDRSCRHYRRRWHARSCQALA